MKSDSYLIWIDLEMTGLVIERDTILEIATVITDNNLNPIAQGPALVISQPVSVLASMDSWNTKYHTLSGLVAESTSSIITLEEAERQTLDFLNNYCEPHKSPFCGNSVYQDRAFLHRYMPALEAFAHYRLIDVSTIKELARRWYPKNSHIRFKKDENHRALQDIYNSIAELQHYREYFFIPPLFPEQPAL